METVDEFLIAERSYCDDESKLSVGLANIRAEVPDIEANKDKILRAARIFKERDVNVALFPEFCLSGYFWDERDDCLAYMEQALHRQPHRLDRVRAAAAARRHLPGDRPEQPHGRGRTAASSTPPSRSAGDRDYLDPENSYDKVFLPGIEKEYTDSGRDDRLVVETELRQASASPLATTTSSASCCASTRSWTRSTPSCRSRRGAPPRNRDYAGMNVRTDHYYGDLWDFVMPASSATNQFWTIACNAVGRHGVTGAPFWGGSGIWAPSGLCLIQASRFNEELVIVHNLDIEGARAAEKDDFNYAFDFKEIYRPLEGSRTFTRHLS